MAISCRSSIRSRTRRALAGALLLTGLAGLIAATAAPPARAADGALPVPRFVTLNTDEANARTGPGRRYPVEWVFVRRHMPVEVVAEYETWRKIRDWEGAEGWVHQSLLSGRRGVVVTAPGDQPLREEPAEAAPVVARAERGVIGRLLHCPGPAAPGSGWCQVNLGGYHGWLPRTALWGVYPSEVIE